MIFYHIDIGENDIVTLGENQNEIAGEIIHVQVTAEQAVDLREFLRLRGMAEVPQQQQQQQENVDAAPRYHIAGQPQAAECEHCYCRPCVTSECHRQAWWAQEPLPAEVGNNSLPKRAYYKFWTMLYHRGA